MPTYEYRCIKCGNVFEKRKSLDEYQSGDSCPNCKSGAEKIFSVPGLIEIR